MKELDQIVLQKGLFALIKGHLCLTKGHLGIQKDRWWEVIFDKFHLY